MVAQDDVSSLLTVRQALRMTAGAAADGTDATRDIFLCTSFTASHLTTLLAAYHLREHSTAAAVQVGGYGDLADNLARGLTSGADVVLALVEWQDLDPRLGRREAVSSELPAPDDLVRTAQLRAARIVEVVQSSQRAVRVVVQLPTLALPPEVADSMLRIGHLEARLEKVAADLAVDLTQVPHCVVVPRTRAPEGYDARADALTGHVYTPTQASRLSQALMRVVAPPSPKKGVITDLDDTLWRGIVGDDGAEAVHWDLDNGSHPHAQYQRLLRALAARGVLVAIASKNDVDTAEAALARDDILLPPDAYFPVVASWGPKSASVSQILRTWNISAEDVVFVDDSATEIAEVSSVHPGITSIEFPTRDAAAVSRVLYELNERFASEIRTEEDLLRLRSIKSSAHMDRASEALPDEIGFLRDLAGVVTMDPGQGWESDRALTLVNKTNQFNLAARRYSANEWQAANTRDDAVHITVEYEDRFGRLGTISVLTGVLGVDALRVDTWVMSCRAFARAIEHHVLGWIFDHLRPASILVSYERTPRNAPMHEFLEQCGFDLDTRILTRESFHEAAGDRAGVHQLNIKQREH